MFRPAALYIGLRYTRAKRRNHFISFISLVSMLGIALGVMVLITVLSVMNGFDREIKKRVFSMVAPITLGTHTGLLADWQKTARLVESYSFVTALAPYVQAEALLNYGSVNQPILINGILPEAEKKLSALSQKMIAGKLEDLRSGTFGIVIGSALANRLGVSLGDKITAFTTQFSVTPAGVLSRSKRFTVVGIFNAGRGFGFDAGLGFIHLNDAQKLMGLSNQVTGLHINIHDVFAAPMLAQELSQELSEAALVTTWADQFGDFFHAVKLEKTMMFFILILILAVAAFNMVSTLVMMVAEKEADIAILRTIGATPKMILSIFIIQGTIIGVLGTVLGVLSGILLASNVTEIVNGIEHLFRVQLLSSHVYFVDYLPSEIKYGDIIKICGASLLLSLLATIYPAWRAAQLNPVESLRYE